MIAGIRRHTVALALAASALMIAPATAENLYWYGDGTNPGGSGNWTGLLSNWSTTATPLNATAWTITATANFGSPAGTVAAALNLTAGAGMVFQAGPYLVTGGPILPGGGSSTANAINTFPGVTATLQAPLIGAGGISKTGSGTLVLAGANTYAGETVVEGGTLRLAATGGIASGGNTFVGYANGGTTLDITAGAIASDVDATLGVQPAADGNIANVTGALAVWANSGTLNVGWEGGFNALNVSSGGTVSSANANLGANVVGSSANQVIVDGVGSSWINAGDLRVGNRGPSNALTVQAHGAVTTSLAHIGMEAGSDNNSIQVTGTGSQWTNTGGLWIGVDGSANIFDIQAGGSASSGRDVVVGYNGASTGNQLNVKTGSTLQVPGYSVIIGERGRGLLEISGGSQVTGKNARVGNQVGSGGNVVNVAGAGSAWINTGSIRIGDDQANAGGASPGGNTFTVSGGGAVSFQANAFLGYAAAPNNTVVVTGAGSSWTNGGSGTALTVGRKTTGNVFTVASGGTATAPLFVIAEQAGSAGAVNIGAGGAAGTLVGPVAFGAGAGVLNFNHVDAALDFANAIGDLPGGSGGVFLIGSGTTIFSAANTHSGGTTLSAGTLRLGVDNALPPAATFTFNGGMLDANDRATHAGALRLQASSTLAFGSSGSRQDLVFASAAPYAGGTLTITGWEGPAGALYDRLMITADPTASGILAHIQFQGYPLGASWVALTGEVRPSALPPPPTVPVPALSQTALAALALLLAVLGFGAAGRGGRERRRQ